MLKDDSFITERLNHKKAAQEFTGSFFYEVYLIHEIETSPLKSSRILVI